MERENSRKLLPFAKVMRRAPSDAEQRIWKHLRNRQLDGLKFRRQQPVGPFVTDFACDEVKLIVEIDGDQHNEAEAYDKARTEKLEELGWRVIRFSARDAVQKTEAILRTILLDARPHPSPLP